MLKASGSPMSVSLQTPDIISALATPPEGADVTLPADGIIMYNYKKVTVNINNPVGALMGLKLTAEPFGKIPPFAPDTQSGWKYSALEGAYYYDLPAANGTISVAIPLVEENNGGHVKLETYYYMVQNRGTEQESSERVSLDIFEFDIVNFKIQAISFVNWEKLNIDADYELPTPEWSMLDGRTAKPQPGVEYNASVSAPAAVARGRKLRLIVTYECHGEDSIKLSAECNPAISSCVYGGFAEVEIECPAFGIGYIIMDSETSSPTVTATLQDFKWKTRDATIGERVNPAEELSRETYHRIYTLYDHHHFIGVGGKIWDRNPWIPTLELGCNLAEGATTEDNLRAKIVQGIHDSTWRSWDNSKIYFGQRFYLKLKYSPTDYVIIVKPDPYDLAIYPLESSNTFWHKYDLTTMINLLQTNVADGFTADCSAFNGLAYILINHLGGSIYGKSIRDHQFPIPNSDLNENCVWPAGSVTVLEGGSFKQHWTLADNYTAPYNYYDATNMLPTSKISYNCPTQKEDANHNKLYDYALKLPETTFDQKGYLELFFTNPPSNLTIKKWRILSTRTQ